ncbi:hypothetical protein B0H17DRAFT_1146524 [Mycena rosella]|uniref:Uncharacterized protein n=1 Tax=Mycena rosella TaxID=1033263 RepID=A0AAD7CR55_MYCRO|nr:hypothetical protein B0H17DRAFT_1146524 [Mycena rosella]
MYPATILLSALALASAAHAATPTYELLQAPKIGAHQHEVPSYGSVSGPAGRPARVLEAEHRIPPAPPDTRHPQVSAAPPPPICVYTPHSLPIWDSTSTHDDEDPVAL